MGIQDQLSMDLEGELRILLNSTPLSFFHLRNPGPKRFHAYLHRQTGRDLATNKQTNKQTTNHGGAISNLDGPPRSFYCTAWEPTRPLHNPKPWYLGHRKDHTARLDPSS